ncbi:MAG: hypothetical protein Q8L46_01495 [candidate division WWE3 bacterium]|nr:hypothetical protein [candidate division WWE3 bacterium]
MINLEKISSGLSQNVAGALTYFLGPVTGILFLLIEKQNKFVRFHAMQSTMLFGGYFVLTWVLWYIPLINVVWGIISIPLSLLVLILWLYLMYQAYEGKEYKLPVVGDFAAQQLGKI